MNSQTLIQDTFMYHMKIIANLGYENLVIFILAVILYLPFVMTEGRKANEQEEQQKCLGVLGLEVAMHSWKTLVMGYICYSLLTYLVWQGVPRTDAFNGAIGGLFFAYFLSFDTNFKTKLGVLTSKLQKLYYSTRVAQKRQF